ncbi:MAG TPA: hypothetical protein VG742_10365 [Dongiaceae bacterium]|nr:hypothetical protein [Dongiaceae bacterium]
MRKWLLIILGVVGVAVVAVLGLSWYALNKPVDLSSPTGQAYAENFKKEFNDSCLSEAEKAAGAADEAMKAKFVVACACAADAVFEEYKDEPPAKMFTLTSDEGERDTMNRIMTTCAQQAGLQ